MIYLDTNVLVYSFCKNVDDLAQKQKAQDILKNAISTNKLLLSEISLYEFSFVCKKLVTFDAGFKKFIKNSKTKITIL